MPTVDEMPVMALAASQHGVVTAGQLATAGLTRHAIAHRVAVGHLTRLHRGVYLAGPLKAPFTDAMAAVLACGEGAVLSHHAAAELWGLRAGRPGPVDVMVRGDAVRARPGIRVHRVRELGPSDVTEREGIPTTTPTRTLLDLATTLPTNELQRAIEQAQIQGLVTLPLNEQFTSHRAATHLRQAASTEPALTRSEAEHRVLELIRKARLPYPSVNAPLSGYEVDFLWPRHHLVLEVDGYAFHATRAAFERDRRRDSELQLRGYRVLRTTWRQATDEPEALIATLAAALTACSPAPAPG